MTPAEQEMLESVKSEVTEQVQSTVLAFLNETIPSMEIPDVEHDDESVKFSVAKLKLEDVQIKKEDIDVKFGDLVKLEGEVLQITTSHIAVTIPKLLWEFEQLGFPYLNGAGTGKVELKEAEVYVSFRLDTSGGGATTEPSLEVASAELKVETLALSIQESWLSPLYNTLLWLVEGMLRDQVVEQANQQLTDQASAALVPLNNDPRVAKALAILVGRLDKQVRRASTVARKSVVGLVSQ